MKKSVTAITDFLNSGKKGILLYTALKDRVNNNSYLFTDALQEVTTYSTSGIKEALDRVDSFVKNGFYAAGYLSYEAGAAFNSRIKPPARAKKPLLYFGIYKKPAIVFNTAVSSDDFFKISNFSASVSEAEYTRTFNKIKKNIRAGEYYQVNYCFMTTFDFMGSPAALFSALTSSQPTAYSAYINDGKRLILSLSPELFFRIDKRTVTMKPMKGTLLKGSHTLKQAILSNKNKAENIMIVDLIRNDLSKICTHGSVKAAGLFDVEEYPTLFQMTSTIKGRIKNGLKSRELFSAVFPSGSVTGAPKIRVMQEITDIEKSLRGVYTGAIGLMSPKGKSVFSIPIRTIKLDVNNGCGEMGIGSGIVHDSTAAAEYQECLGKARFLRSLENNFGIIESFLFSKSSYFLLNYHMKRMKKSCKYFSVPFDFSAIKKKLRDTSARLDKKSEYKLRLVLYPDGRLEALPVKIRADRTLIKLAVSPSRISSANVFLRHKTTRRKLYDSEYEKYAASGFGDVIYMNEWGEITEAHSSNIFIKKNNVFYTPPVSCGLLPGTLRQFLLETYPLIFKEKKLFLQDLKTADAIYLSNSVRGLCRACLT